MIVAVSSNIGEGKDTFYSFFQKHSIRNFENKKFAYKLKQIVSLLTGCKVEDLENEEFKNSFLPEIWRKSDGSKYTYREALQYIGTDLFRNQFHIDTWVNGLFSEYKNDSNFIITDLRFKSEFDITKKYKDSITVKVIRKMTVLEWLKSKYFKFLCLPTHSEFFLYKKWGESKISKSELINYFLDIKEMLIPSDTLRSKEFEKLTHQSERDLDDYLDKFDYVLVNDGTLEDFENTVKSFVEEIEQKF